MVTLLVYCLALRAGLAEVMLGLRGNSQVETIVYSTLQML
jgi:hypothetical protein